MPGVTGTLGKANSHFDPTQTRSGTAPPRWAAVDWCFSLLLFYRATIGPQTLDSSGERLIRREALVAPSAVPCSFSLLISRIHSSLFLDWRRTVSSKFFGTQVSTVSSEEVVLRDHARCALSHLRCNGNSLPLSSYLSRIGRIENLSCSACGQTVPGHLSSHSALSSNGLFAPLALWRLSVSLRPVVQALRSCLAYGAP